MNLIYYSVIVIIIAWLLGLWLGIIAGFGWLMSLVLGWFGINLVWWKCGIVWVMIVITGKIILGMSSRDDNESLSENSDES